MPASGGRGPGAVKILVVESNVIRQELEARLLTQSPGTLGAVTKTPCFLTLSPTTLTAHYNRKPASAGHALTWCDLTCTYRDVTVRKLVSGIITTYTDFGQSQCSWLFTTKVDRRLINSFAFLRTEFCAYASPKQQLGNRLTVSINSHVFVVEQLTYRVEHDGLIQRTGLKSVTKTIISSLRCGRLTVEGKLAVIRSVHITAFNLNFSYFLVFTTANKIHGKEAQQG
ncbi:hypothetical protein BaRGS_00028326 [Batillaria attramentaria]|uniref:Uncharacterized protein n=1 Tax=Batillaria attramentaria TaxID=370345 RepID=A0ABD0K0D1_9CAEN